MTLNISPLSYNCSSFKSNLQPSFAQKITQTPADSVEISKKNVKRGSGCFADKKFEIEASEGFNHRDLAGEVDGVSFDIRHQGKFLKADIISGYVGDKELNLKVKEKMFGADIEGTIGDKPVDLRVSDTWAGKRIKGQFKDKNIDIKLNSKFVGYSIESDKINLRVKNKNFFGNDVNLKGTYNEDPDLIPILMDTVYRLQEEELMAAMLLL